ncbi:MAG: Gfo/Idh/MocA family oxidoreductase [Balneolaceae bacterium]
MKNYNWGILGAGSIAWEFTKGLKLVPRSNTYSVYSRTYEKALKFSDLLGFEKTSMTFEAFLDDPDLDIVYIATPNNLHYEHAIQCLEAGKHVLIEKPIALCAWQAQEIEKTANENQCLCMEAMWSRFMPLYLEIKNLLQENVIGEIKYFSASFGEAMMYEPKTRIYNLKAGGGCLLDLGVYPISLALMLLGEPESVSGSCRKSESGVDTLDSFSLHYKNGAIADLQCSFDCKLPNNTWISGTNGSIDIPNPIYRPNRYRISKYHPYKIQSNPGYGTRDKLHEISFFSNMLHAIGNYMADPFRKFKQTKWVNFTANGYQYEALEFMKNLDRGELQSDIMPLSDSIAVLKITDQLRRDWGIDYPETKNKTEHL